MAVRFLLDENLVELKPEDAAAILTEDEKKDEKAVSNLQRLFTLTTGKKVKAALTEDAQARSFLIRDPNRLVALAVLGSPKVTEAEIDKWGKVRVLERWVQQGLQPDLTLLFDVSPAVGRRRAGRKRRPDRFEREREAYYRRVRAAYLRRARGGGPDEPLLLDGWHLLVDAVAAGLAVDAVAVNVDPPGPAEARALDDLIEAGAPVDYLPAVSASRLDPFETIRRE